MGLNTIVLATFAARWWIILRFQGVKVGFLPVMLYRLAAFGVSYLTPGPQFGGEPVQVLLLQTRHDVPAERGIASVTLEKAIELGVNGLVLFAGALFVFQSGLVPGFGVGGVFGSFLLMAVPVGLLGVMWAGVRPFSPLLRGLPTWLTSRKWFQRMLHAVAGSEDEIIRLCAHNKPAIIGASVVSALSWVLVVGEYGLALAFLGSPLPPNEVMALVLAARAAILLPTPGGLGAVEASQMIVTQALGYDPSIGLGVSVLIRARDLAFATVGIVVALATNTLTNNTRSPS
jgi:uncharacterized protein (TIRG00374 family)